METFDINDLASIGVVKDQPPYMLPPEAFSLGVNVRYRNRGIEKGGSWEQVFGTPGVAPHFAIPVSTASADYWVYVSLLKGYVYDGTTHTNITRQNVGVDVNYTATETKDWNAAMLGGVLILNNGNDVPQYWPTASPATKLANLTNWQAAVRAKIIRAFGPYLMAFNITDTGASFPHLVRWSHPADPGSIPSSWDVTDPTKDTGQKDLVGGGVILDALPLQGTMYAYKESATHRINPIGGRFIFDFKPFSETSGILAPRCVALTGDGTRHVVVTQDDVIWHNGNQVESILDGRWKQYLFNDMDTVNFGNTFLLVSPLTNEVWICYPPQGATQPTRALVWNYKEAQRGVLSEMDGLTFRNAAVGTIEGDSDELWSDGEDEWEEDTGPWSILSRRKVVLCGTDSTKFFVLDRGSLRGGAAFTATLQREGLAILGRKRSGEWIVDHEVEKLISRFWPKLQGGPVRFRLGTQELVNGPITWGPYVTFDPTLGVTADIDPASGRAFGFEINDQGTDWRLDGYKVELSKLGQF